MNEWGTGTAFTHFRRMSVACFSFIRWYNYYYNWQRVQMAETELSLSVSKDLRFGILPSFHFVTLAMCAHMLRC